MLPFSSTYSFLVLIVAYVSAQTPSGYSPATNNNLVVKYGSTVINAGVTLDESTVASVPSLFASASFPAMSAGSYIAIMVDSKIIVNGTQTTALHWYQPDFTMSSDRSLTVRDTYAPSAQYVSPAPAEAPNLHAYVILLFKQPDGYQLPSCYMDALPETGRMGFDVNEFVSVTGIGDPVAANWFNVPEEAGGPSPTSTPTSTYLSSAMCGPSKMVRAIKGEMAL